jgi:two-component system, NarL family, response regulator NreC
MSMSRTTLVLADDHPVVRQGLRALLEAEPGFHIVGEADDGVAAAQLAERLKPDVLLVDVMMPGLNGLEVTRQVRQRCPWTRVIVLSMHANEAYVLEALRHGAAGYVLKESSTAELVQAVRTVVAGRRHLSPPLSERAIEAYAQKAAPSPLDIYETLTTREREVLQMAAEGRRNSEIAARLAISPRTAETHRTHLMRKLGLHNQADLIRYALRRGLVPLEQ